MTKPHGDGRPDATTPDILRMAERIRRRVLRHTLDDNGGYLSQACSAGELLSTLYLRVMRLGGSVAPSLPRPFAGPPGAGNPDAFTGAGYNGPHEPGLDRFYFSPVHYALVLYSALIELGRLSEDGLDQFNKDGSTVELIGAEHSPGHEVTAGSLAQCLSQAGGVAMARRMRREAGRNVVFMSDGEFQEGQTWETVSALAFHRLDNVMVYVDANGQQCDGAMRSVMTIEPLRARLEAFGARAVEVDGHDPDALSAPAALAPDGRPLFVIARTDPCRGFELLRERSPKLHYVRFKSDAERALYEASLTGSAEMAAGRLASVFGRLDPPGPLQHVEDMPRDSSGPCAAKPVAIPPAQHSADPQSALDPEVAP